MTLKDLIDLAVEAGADPSEVDIEVYSEGWQSVDSAAIGYGTAGWFVELKGRAIGELS